MEVPLLQEELTDPARLHGVLAVRVVMTARLHALLCQECCGSGFREAKEKRKKI